MFGARSGTIVAALTRGRTGPQDEVARGVFGTTSGPSSNRASGWVASGRFASDTRGRAGRGQERIDPPLLFHNNAPGSPASQRATSWLGGNGPLGPGPKALRAAPAFSCRNACFHNLVACSTERDYDWVIPSKIRKGIYAARVLVCDATTRSSVHQAQTFLRSRLGRLYSNLGLRISIQPSSEGMVGSATGGPQRRSSRLQDRDYARSWICTSQNAPYETLVHKVKKGSKRPGGCARKYEKKAPQLTGPSYNLT
jgi:hypothetical protein